MEDTNGTIRDYREVKVVALEYDATNIIVNTILNKTTGSTDTYIYFNSKSNARSNPKTNPSGNCVRVIQGEWNHINTVSHTVTLQEK